MQYSGGGDNRSCIHDVCKGAGIKHLRFVVLPVVINFHPLSRDNVSIMRQPQPGCSLFHQITSRDHVIVVHLRKQKKPSFLPYKKNKVFTHERHNLLRI